MYNYPKTIKNHTKIAITCKKDGEKITVLDTTPENRVTGKVVAGIPITESIDDTLDTFVFIIKAYKRELFEEFDVVDFTVQNNGVDEVHQMVVAFDVSEIYQRYLNPPTYQHTVTMVESTKILEKFKIHSLNLTNAQDTLLRQAEKAINNAVTLVKGATYEDKCIFSLSDKLKALLTDKAGEDFYFSNTDLRSVMDGILQSNDCRAAVEHIGMNDAGDINSIVIGYRSFSAVNEVEPVWTQEDNGAIVYEELRNHCQNYAGKLYAKGINTICKNPLTVTDTFKSGTAAISDTTACIFLPFPISERGFEKFVVSVILLYGEKYDVDIAEWLIPQSQYDMLSESDSKMYIPYDIGNSIINVGTYVNKQLGITTSNNFKTILQRALQKDLDPIDIRFSTTVPWHSFKFTYTYYPQITTYSEVSKPGVYDKDRLRMGIWDNQTENNLDMERHGKRLLSLIRRTGNGERYVDVNADYFSNLLPIMTKIKDTGYVIYKREISVFDINCKCRYYLSKDYNAVQSKSGVNRVKHLYDIPLESDECPLAIKQYMVFSKSAPKVCDTTFSADFIKKAIQTALGRAESGSKVNYMLFRSQGGDNMLYPQNTENADGNKVHDDYYNRFMRPCVTYGQGKSMDFIAKTLDNYSVDYSRDGYQFGVWGDGGHRMTYNRYVSKEKDSVGECNKFFIAYAYSCATLEVLEESKEYYSFVDRLPVSDYRKYEIANNKAFEINYIKDRTQSPVFFTSIECVPSEENFNNIVIGTAFCRDNNLVTDNSGQNKNLSLVVLTNGTFFDSDNTLDGKTYIKAGNAADYFTVETAGAYAILKNIKSVGGNVRGWAIVNERGEIIVACNGDLCDLYVFLCEYPQSFLMVKFADEPKTVQPYVIQWATTVGSHAVTFSDEKIDMGVNFSTPVSSNTVTFSDQATKAAVQIATPTKARTVKFSDQATKIGVKFATRSAVGKVEFSDQVIKIIKTANRVE